VAERESRGRVLHLTTVPIGIPGQVLPMARAQVQAGWEVDVACSPGPETELLAPAGVGYRPVPFSRSLASLQHPKTYRALVRLLRERRYDIVHVHGPIPGVLGRLAGRRTGTRVVSHVRGTFFSEGPDAWYGGAVKALYPLSERALAPLTSWTLALTGPDGEDLARRGGHDPQRITVLGVGACGLDLETWDPERYDEETRARTRRELEIPEGKPVIGFVGRVVREKGVLELADAFARVRAAGVDAHLLVVGGVDPSERDQDTLRELRARIERTALAEHVSLPGFVRPSAPAVAVMDLLVLPSHREGMPNVLSEAGALGKPVVAAACRGCRAAVRDGETGLLVPVGDAPALAEAMLSILRDPALTRRMGEAGRDRAQALGREGFMRAVHEVYERVLALPAPGARTR